MTIKTKSAQTRAWNRTITAEHVQRERDAIANDVAGEAGRRASQAMGEKLAASVRTTRRHAEKHAIAAGHEAATVAIVCDAWEQADRDGCLSLPTAWFR